MALREDMLPIFNDGRALAESFGLRTNALTIRKRTWTGPPGMPDSTYDDDDLEITPKPKMRTVSAKEIAASGGLYRDGDLRVTKITPQYSGGGYTPEQCRLAGGAGVQALYLVTGPAGGECSLVDSDFSKNFGYELTLRRTRATP